MRKNGSDLIRKYDVILLIIIAILALAAWLCLHFFMAVGKTAVIRVDGKVIKTVSLDQDGEGEIPLTNGANRYQIKEGKISMISADCPDKICVKHKAISQKGETIVCLPHKVVIEIDDQSQTKENESDSIDVYTK